MKRILLFMVAFIAYVSVDAQVTTSSLTGKVLDNNGVSLIGATVLAVHTPSGTQYGTVTNPDGFYNIIGMRVGGPYKVTVSYVGYQTFEKIGDYLSLGSPTLIDFIMNEDGVILDEIVISSSKDSRFTDSKTGAAVNINSEKINSLPTISRSLNDFTRLTPQSNGNSFAGTNSRFNNYTIDGNIYNNNFGLGSGQFAGGSPISLDAVEAVSVNLAPYDVRYSGFTGAAVNAVTKSGTNDFKGSAYYIFRNDQMIGNKAGNLAVDRGTSENTIFGATLGGALIKNKLFFFASYEKEQEATPSFLKRAARPGETPDGLIISRVTLEQANFVRNQMQSLYGYDTGDPDGYNFSSEQQRINVRLDYNLSKNHKISARYNNYNAFTDVPTNGNSIRYIQTRYRNTSRTGVENINFRNNNYTNDRTVQSYVGEINSIFGSKISNQLNVGFTSITDPKRGIPGGQDFPFIEVLQPDASGNLLYFMTMGNELFTVGNLLENRTFNITNNTTYFMGKHTLTGGFNFEYMTFDNAFNPTFNAFYRFNSYQKFVDAVINKNANVFPDAFAKGYALDGSTTPPTDRTKFAQLGLYVQDEFQVNRGLKLTAGLRVDLPSYPIDLPENTLLTAKNKTFTDGNGNSFVPDVRDFPKINPLFSPRIGFNYDVTSDRKTVIRGGTGIFSGRIPFVWLSNQVNGSGVVRGGFGYEGNAVVTNNIRFNPDVTAYNPENPSQALSNELNLTDRNFRLPQVWRSNLGIDQKLPFGIEATLEFMYNRDVSTPIAYNAVLRNPDRTLSGPDTRSFWSSTNYSNDSDFRNVFYLTNANTKADYYSLTAQLSKTFNNGFYTMFAYTNSRSRDLDAAGGSQAVSLWTRTVQSNRNNPELGLAGFDIPHKVLGVLSYQMNGTTLGLFYEGSNAGRYSYTYSGNFGDASNRLIFVPNKASDLTFEQFSVGSRTITPADQAKLLDDYIDQDPYLSKIRGSVAERNGLLGAWVNRFDLRIAQDVVFNKKDRNKLQLTIDITNVGNMFNSEWGIPKVPFTSNILTYRGVTSDNVPRYRFNLIPGTQQFLTETFRYSTNVLGNAWRMQFGIKYIL